MKLCEDCLYGIEWIHFNFRTTNTSVILYLGKEVYGGGDKRNNAKPIISDK